MATAFFDPNVLYEIQHVGSNRCLNLCGGDLNDGAVVHVWDDHIGVNEDNCFLIQELQPGVVEIISAVSHRCLNLCGGEVGEQAEVILWGQANSDNPHNRWKLIEHEPGEFLIQSLFSGRFLAVADGAGDDYGAPVVVTSQPPSPRNTWWIVPSTWAPDDRADDDLDGQQQQQRQEGDDEEGEEGNGGTSPSALHVIMSAWNGRAVDHPPCSEAPPRPSALVWQLHGDHNQCWAVEDAGHGRVRLRMANSPAREAAGREMLCLACFHADQLVGVQEPVAVPHDDGDPSWLAQCWALRQCRPGLFRIVSALTGAAVAVQDRGRDDGTPLALVPPSGSDDEGGDGDPEALAQLWRLAPARFPAAPLPFLGPHDMRTRHAFSCAGPGGAAAAMQGALASLRVHGFAVVEDVLSTAEVAEATRLFGQDLLACVDGGVAMDPRMSPPAVAQAYEALCRLSTSPEAAAAVAAQWPADPDFHPNDRGLAQGSAAWYVRGHRGVRAAFAAALGAEPDELCAGMDMVFYYPRGTPGAARTALWPHVDHNACLDPQQHAAYQGVVSLWDSCDDGAATTVVWPGSHEGVFAALSRHAAPAVPHHHVTLDALHCRLPADGDDSEAAAAARARRAGWYRERFLDEGRRVPLRAGSLLLWDSRTVHQGWSPGERLAIPVCLEPRARRPPQALRRKMRLAATGLPSTHWASLGEQHPNVDEARLFRAAPATLRDGRCTRLPASAPLRSAALQPVAAGGPTADAVRAACAALQATDDNGEAEAAALAAMLRPDVLALL
jgi:hypothetical protein